MKINQKLNVVIEMEDEGGTSYVHAEPISAQTFERYYKVIAKTFAAIHGGGLGSVAGPRVASLLLKDIATDLGLWEDGEDGSGVKIAGVQSGLMNEIRRLANVIALKDGKWQTIPLQEAVDKKLMNPEDLKEVENAIVFFTVYSSMMRRPIRRAMMMGAAEVFGAQITSLNSTEFAASLPTSTGTANTGEKATV